MGANQKKYANWKNIRQLKPKPLTFKPYIIVIMPNIIKQCK